MSRSSLEYLRHILDETMYLTDHFCHSERKRRLRRTMKERPLAQPNEM
jgi:hypothetical protein